MSEYIPADDTPSIPGFEEAATRIVFGQWIDTDGQPVTPLPVISYANLPYIITGRKVEIFAGDSLPDVQALPQPTDVNGDPIPGTAGIWYAEVLCQDPDVDGDIAIRISHPLLSRRSVQLPVPAGTDPLNVADALASMYGLEV